MHRVLKWLNGNGMEWPFGSDDGVDGDDDETRPLPNLRKGDDLLAPKSCAFHKKNLPLDDGRKSGKGSHSAKQEERAA